MPKVDLSIIVPCFNEGPTFESSVKKIIGVAKNLEKTWEIIFVEDKSVDGTKIPVEKITKKYKNIYAIFHKKNEGRGKCVAEGIKKATGEICGYLDVDLEVSANYIPIFIESIGEGNDMAVATRFYERGGLKSLNRFFASRGYSQVVRLVLNLPLSDTEAGYKFFNRKRILPVLSKVKNKHWFWDTEICAQAHYNGLKIIEIPVIFKRRLDKKSTVKVIPDSIHFALSILKFKLNRIFK